MAKEEPKSKKPEKETEDMLKAKLNRWWDSALGGRKELDWKWFQYDLWVAGYHYAKYDKITQQITTIQPADGEVKIVVNKIYTTLRAVRNFALRNRPRAEVTPENMTAENVGEAVKVNRYLDYLYDRLGLSLKLKESMWHALKYSTGFWQVLWDEDGNDGKGEIAVNVIDPYDLYFDPSARSETEARYVFLAVTKTIDALKEDEKYDQEVVKTLKGEAVTSASSVKSRLLQLEKGEYISSKDKGNIVVKECWFKEKDKIRLVTIAEDKILRDEVTDLVRLPFFKLSADIEPLSLYGQGWVKNLIPVNRLLNTLESQVAEYNFIMNKGKWISDKGAGVRVINNAQGQIIEKKRGFDVHQVTINALSGAIFNQIENTNRYIEDIGGAHDASMGRIPTGATSGKALEALQVGDSNNLSEIIENCEVFLEDVYEYMLFIASKKYQFARNIAPIAQTGEREFIKVIGEDAQSQPSDATRISASNIVDVRITSWLAMTGEARRDALKELYQLQAIDQQTLLDGYGIGNIADVIKRLREQKLQDKATEMASNEMVGEQQTEQANAQAEAQAQQEQNQQAMAGSGAREAISAIRMLINGQNPTIPEIINLEYTDYIDQFLASPEAQSLDPAMVQVIQQFRDTVLQTSQQVR
jgi:hypothetical protein